MCGRYVLSTAPSQVRNYLEDRDMPVDDAPDDDAEGAPRQSYNFAPGNYGVVYRADVPDRGAGPGRSHAAPVDSKARREEAEEGDEGTVPESTGAPSAPSPAADAAVAEEQGPAGRYRLQSMKWGLVPSWTKRSPGYGSMLKTINCRSESLSGSGGMWTTMKMRKRCVVVADGFFEWLKVGPKEKVPHYVKRKDGQPMLFAGLWDCVRLDDSDEKLYTYTIITVDSNPQLRFLHDRMPAVLEPSKGEVSTWLDPARTTWTRELQDILRPTSAGLEVYPVSKEVGKVGNDSPSFVIPVASKENKSNIANFFANADEKKEKKKVKSVPSPSPPRALSEAGKGEVKRKGGWEETKREELESGPRVTKRGASPPESAADEPPAKIPATRTSPRKKSKYNATSNGTRAPAGGQGREGSRKITSFFAKTT